MDLSEEFFWTSTHLGRKPTPLIDWDKIIVLFEKNPSLSVRKIARKIRMSSGYVGKVLKDHRLNKDVA